MSDDTTLETQGRQIRLIPLPTGTWGMILGAGVGVLAPLGGFLVGSILGPGEPGAAVNPMFMALFVGIVIGAVGVLAAIASGFRLARHLAKARAA